MAKKQNGTKVYIVSKIGWEYNDEYYYRPESEGGLPVEAYKDRSKAELRCIELNTKEFDAETVTYTGKGEEGYEPITQYYEVLEVVVED